MYISRSTRSVLAAGLACFGFVVPGSITTARADQYDNQIAKIQREIQAEQAHLRSVIGSEKGVNQNITQLQGQISTTDDEIAIGQQRVDTINGELAKTAANITRVNAQLVVDKTNLAGLLSHTYEMDNSGYPLQSVLDAQSLSDAADAIAAFSHVSDDVGTLIDRVGNEKASLVTLQASEQAQETEATQAVNQLQGLRVTEASQVASLQSELAGLTGSAAGSAHQVQALQHQLQTVRAAQAAAQAAAAGGGGTVIDGAVPPFAFGPRPDDFPWGQCTWYVASLRTVTWSGDAWAWAGNARAQGMPEGMTPRVGAMVVWGRYNGYSEFGHVAYVVAVQSSSRFTVSEANYVGLGVVDERQIYSLSDVEAFIY